MPIVKLKFYRIRTKAKKKTTEKYISVLLQILNFHLFNLILLFVLLTADKIDQKQNDSRDVYN